MQTVHAENESCRHSWYRFGTRRHRCRSCGITRRFRPRRRGPKRKRRTETHTVQYLDNVVGSLRAAARHRGIPRETFRRRFVDGLSLLEKHADFGTLPKHGRLIAIADATGVRCYGREWTLYVLLLRPVHGNHAIILPPLLFPAREGKEWACLFTSLDDKLLKRISALVCDGNPYLLSIARKEGWVTQRCHFHLKAHLRSYLSWGARSRSRIWALLALMSVQTILDTDNDGQCTRAETMLRSLTSLIRSKKAQWTIRDFLRQQDTFRSYRTYTSLRLPTTSNAAESLNNLLKNHLRRTRGLPTPEALEQHMRAIMKQKQTMYCPPALQPN